MTPPTRPRHLIDGRPADERSWDALELAERWPDAGPSPSGNAGPYWKVPSVNGETVHRVYCRDVPCPDGCHEGREGDGAHEGDGWLDRHRFGVGVVAGALAGVAFVLGLRPPTCADSWTFAVPGLSGACPVGAYVAEHPAVGGGALVVCRCRPEPRTSAPESRP